MNTIKEFIEQMKHNNINVSNLISVKKYISFSDKILMAKDIVDFSVDYDRGFVKIDSVKKYLSFIFAVIESHTDLRFADQWEDKMLEYDLLCENELLDMIIGAFEKDYHASREVLDLMCENLIAEHSVEASAAKLAQSVSENLDVLAGVLADKLEDLDVEKIIPKDLDLDKLQGLLSNFK